MIQKKKKLLIVLNQPKKGKIKMAKKPVKKTVKKDVIPQEIINKLKKVKLKFFKKDTIKTVREKYLEIYKEDKEKYKDKGWSDLIHHKRALTKLKNQKKSEKLGGAVDNYYGIVFGASKVNDLSKNRRANIIQAWEDDPQKTIDDGLIMTRQSTNPVTNEIEKVPILDESGGIIPKDNIEYGTRKDGKKFKNPNFNKVITHAYRRNITGVCSNTQGIKGIFTHELRNKSVELDIPTNVLVKFSGKTLGTEVITMTKNKYIDGELLKEMIDNLEDDIEQGIITTKYAKDMKEHYTNLLLLTKEGEGEEIEITSFKLRSTKGTSFTIVESEKEFENVDFPMKDHMQLDINLIYKEYFYPLTSDCSNLLTFHKKHRYIDKDPEKINYNEIVCLQDVNLIQINMEASMGGNYTLYIEDESLFNKSVSHLDEDIDTIRILVPSHIKLNFAQDSKLNIIGCPLQFQAQDEERKEIWEIETDEDGKETKVPVMAFPLIMVHGIYPIPEYMIEVDIDDLTLDDELPEDDIKVDEIFEKSKKKPKTKKKAEIEDIKDGIEDLDEMEADVLLEKAEEEDHQKKLAEKKTTKKPEISDEIDDEDESEDEEIW